MSTHQEDKKTINGIMAMLEAIIFMLEAAKSADEKVAIKSYLDGPDGVEKTVNPWENSGTWIKMAIRTGETSSG